MTPSLVQVGLVADGAVRQAFGRFLELVAEVDPAVSLREEPFRIVIDHAGAPLLVCRPRATSVVIAGQGGSEGTVCRAPREFAAALEELLGLVRGRLAGAGPARGPASPLGS